MKTHFFLIAFLYSLVTAQVDSLDQLRYYPLSTGDYWEYRLFICQFPTCDDSSAYSVEITGDTILSNGYSYKLKVTKNIYGDTYEGEDIQRVDSSTGYVYHAGYEDTILVDYVILKLFAQPWGRIEVQDHLFELEEDTSILGVTTHVQTFSEGIAMHESYDSYAQGFGFCRRTAGSYDVYSTIDLVFARINGISYGNSITKVKKDESLKLITFNLYQNYPNPFNPITTIKFQIPNSNFTTLKVYSILGEEVATLVSTELNQGSYTYRFDGKDFASGIYYYQLVSGKFQQVKKMLILK